MLPYAQKKLTCLALLFLSLGYCAARAQSSSTADRRSPLPASLPGSDTDQTAQILGLAEPLAKLSALQSQRPCGTPLTMDEISARQQLSDLMQLSTLEVDGALAEIRNEREKLGDLKASLGARRDHRVGLLNSAALITGSGVEAIAGATQFTNLSTRTQNVGIGIGIGSGATSTVLSFLAYRKQAGPKSSVGEVPNMLAPLFDKPTVLHTAYPASVLRFLDGASPGQDTAGDTRLEQLKDEWIKMGRMNTSTPVNAERSIAAATTSADPSVKVSIDDLTNRIAMLGDVSGRVLLMKRDLAALMRSYINGSRRCTMDGPGPRGHE